MFAQSYRIVQIAAIATSQTTSFDPATESSLLSIGRGATHVSAPVLMSNIRCLSGRCAIAYVQHVTGYFVCRKIKVWDLKAAMDPRSPTSALCLRTLVVSCNRVCIQRRECICCGRRCRSEPQPSDIFRRFQNVFEHVGGKIDQMPPWVVDHACSASTVKYACLVVVPSRQWLIIRLNSVPLKLF